VDYCWFADSPGTETDTNVNPSSCSCLQVENIIRREMERINLSDDDLETLRNAQAATMLTDMKALVAAKKDMNVPVCSSACIACNMSLAIGDIARAIPHKYFARWLTLFVLCE
jgi:hypothetical protein